ncbi:hypothetical protein [Sphingomonas faeni]|uniref:hypothetical protein n=1 Tax=Sphingomonas faeni TaxID=185950 RepID=UPI0020C7D5CD|nr:hypothetical protein [Sphingomonas faeni]MCP8892902.1 hypothetical protein [Sphingomonas faeni]
MGRMNDDLREAFRSFGISSAAAMLKKAEREYHRFVGAADNDDRRDAAINCALTQWHVTDWLWVALEKDDTNEEIRRVFGITEARMTKKLFLAAVERDCPEIALCQSVANGSKHVLWGSHVKSLEKSLLDNGTMPQVADDPLYIYSKGQPVEAAKVFYKVQDYWENLGGWSQVFL